MNKHMISIITVVENDPVTGIKYGATKIALPEEKNCVQTIDMQKACATYAQAKACHTDKLKSERTTQK